MSGTLRAGQLITSGRAVWPLWCQRHAGPCGPVSMHKLGFDDRGSWPHDHYGQIRCRWGPDTALVIAYERMTQTSSRPTGVLVQRRNSVNHSQRICCAGYVPLSPGGLYWLWAIQATRVIAQGCMRDSRPGDCACLILQEAIAWFQPGAVQLPTEDWTVIHFSDGVHPHRSVLGGTPTHSRTHREV